MLYRRVTIAARYELRLEDLQASDAVAAQCGACGKEWLIATHRLHDRFKPYERMVKIGEQMRCKHCGTGSAMAWYVMRAEAS